MGADVIEVRKFKDTDVFQTDLKQIFDFIRCSKERDKLLALVQSDPAYQEMDEAAYDMVAEYANSEGLIEMKKYHGKGGNVNMCKALEDLMADSRKEGREEGREEGLTLGIVAIIEAYQEFQVSSEETIIKLEEKFNLSRECAEDYVKKYWK